MQADLQLEAEEHQSAGIIEKAEHHISTEEDNVMDVNMKRFVYKPGVAPGRLQPLHRKHLAPVGGNIGLYLRNKVKK